MRVVFMGTPDFAVPSLLAVRDAGHELAAVVTQPDRPRGRGQRVQSAPVKEAALRLGVPIQQPEKVRDPSIVAWLRELAPDAIIVVAYGQKIPRSILTLPRYGCINVHASLLPKYRGAAPIHWALINGEEVTGVTTMRMDEGWDTGDILLQQAVGILPGEDVGSLHDRLAQAGGHLLAQTLDGVAQGTIRPVPQDHEQATYAPKLTREDGILDWGQPAVVLERRVRGLTPWPGAYTTFRGKGLKVWRVRLVGDVPGHPGTFPGEVVEAHERLVVATGQGYLELESVQPENGRRMRGTDFVNGYRLRLGDRLG